jgi:hypothetical protein
LTGIEMAAYPTFVERLNAAGVQIFIQEVGRPLP